MPAPSCQTAFQFALVGMMMSRERAMLDVSDEAAHILGYPHTTMMGQSFELLCPTHGKHERTGARIIPVMNIHGSYSDERTMKRTNGELFWCHVTSRTLDRAKPLGKGIWTFEDLSAHRLVTATLIPRKRGIATQLVEGKTDKQISKQLGIGPHMVEICRARLVEKYTANALLELVQRLMGHRASGCYTMPSSASMTAPLIKSD